MSFLAPTKITEYYNQINQDMDEEVEGREMEVCRSSKLSREEKKRSSVMSLERSNFDLNRDPSLGQKANFLQVMNLDGSDKNEDLYDQLLFEERKRLLLRSSNQMKNEEEDQCQEHRKSNHTKRTFHQCLCHASCCGALCPCFDARTQMCLSGECCLNCITQKLKIMKHDLQKIKAGGCLCKNTRCVKSYCRCFQAGRKCTSECLCVDCLNGAASNNRRKNQPKVGRGNKADVSTCCSCKKSHCLKKYCKCYSEGRQCNQNCTCRDCRNRLEEDDAEEVRRQRERYGRIQSEDDCDIDQYFAVEDYDDRQMPASMEFQPPNLRQAFNDH